MPKSHYEQGQSPQPGRRSRLGLETLEDRTVLSTASPALSLQAVALSYDPNSVLVQFRDGATPHAERGTSLGQALSSTTGLYDVHLQAGVTVADALRLYRADATVLKVEPNYLLGTATIPNDSQFSNQWALQNPSNPSASIHAVQAWDVTRGSSKTIVAINDTGVDYTHKDLYQNIWINQKEIPASRLRNLVDYNNDGFISMRDLNDPRNQGVGKITDLNGNGYIDGGDLLQSMVKDSSGHDTGRGGWADGISQDGSGYVDDIIGWNFFANNNNPYDDFGHGTHVAGTIGASGNNNLGVTGIDWNVQLMPIKFLGAGGGGTVSQFIAGLNFAVSHGARISNNSWSGAAFSTVLSDAIANAGSRGHIFVAAAGNYGADNDTNPAYPSSFRLDNVVSVAATDRNNALAGFSDYGKTSVQLGAPGVDILSTLPGGNYGYLSGTSMATPHVTGVLALVWSEHPDWTYRQVINQVLSTVTKISSLQGKTVTGGLLDAAAAVGGASVSSVASLHIVDSMAKGPTSASLNKITVKFDAQVNVGTFTAADVFLVGADGSVLTITGVNAVAGSGDRSFDITFANQTKAGYYKVRVGPDVKGVSGGILVTFNSSFYLAPGSTPPPTPTSGPLHIIDSTASGSTGASLNKITVKFDAQVNASTFTAADVFLVGADGSVLVVTGVNAVPGSGNRNFDLTFATQTRAGYYKVRVGPDVQSVSGGSLVVFNSSFYLAAGSTPPPTPTSGPLHIIDSTATGPTGASLNKITVKFDAQVNASTFTAADVFLVGADGSVLPVTGVNAVAGSGNRNFDLTFATQTKTGYYKFRVGPNVQSVSGGSLVVFNSSYYLNAGTTHNPPPTPTPGAGVFVSTAQVNIPRAGRGVSLMTINSNITIRSVKIEINIMHPNMGDLYIHVQGPDGTNIVLANRKGGPTPNMIHTVFDDNAGLPIALGRGPFTGSFQPDSSLSNLAGKNANGVWKLWIEDRIGSSQGILTSWSVIVN